MCGYTTQWQINYRLYSTHSNYLPGIYEVVFNLLLWIPCMFYHRTWQLACTCAKRLHVDMLPCRVNSYFVHSIMFINNIILGQTHTTALHSRFANYAPNTRVLISQGSRINFAAHENTKVRPPYWSSIRTLWGLLWNVSLFPLATQLPEMHPARLWYSILTSFNTILIPWLLVLFSLDVLHTLWMHACRQKFGEVKSCRERF